MKSYIFAGLALLGLAGLGGAGEQARPDATPQKKAASAISVARPVEAKKHESGSVIGFLEGRDDVITIKSSERGPVYSGATKGGKVLFENLSAKQLEVQAPGIHHLIKTGIAADSRGQRSYLDASVWPSGAGRVGNSGPQRLILDAGCPLR